MKHVHGHDILEDNISVYTFQEEEDYSANQIRKNANRMIVESIETSHSKEKEKSDTYNRQNLFSSNIASENFENSNTFLISKENSKINFFDILGPVQLSSKSKRKFTSSSISRDKRYKTDQSKRMFEQSRKQRFHAAFGVHLNTNQNFQNHQNHQNQKTGFTSY